jgi:predicted anti-sigma-YlaC factor YlaD
MRPETLLGKVLGWRASKGAGRRLPCEEVRKHASDFMDGAVRPAILERIKAHLAMCDGCTSFFNTLRSTLDLLKAMPREQPPVSLNQFVRDLGRPT